MAAVSWTIQENYLSCADLFPVQSCSSTVCDELLPFCLVGFLCVCCRCSDSRQAGDHTGLCSSSLPVCTHTCGQKHVYIYTDYLCVHKATQWCLPDVSSSWIIPVGRSLERRVLPASAVSLTLGLKCRRMTWPEGHTGWAVTCHPRAPYTQNWTCVHLLSCGKCILRQSSSKFQCLTPCRWPLCVHYSSWGLILPKFLWWEMSQWNN